MHWNEIKSYGPMSATRFERIKIGHLGSKNWRTVVRDDCGDWSVTGPPYATKLEALSVIDEVERTYFH
jgi:hypothetical protein